MISAATFRLLGGFFACQPVGTPLLKGVAPPVPVYRVLYESMARSRLEAVGTTGSTPLVGREQEIALLQERWAQAQDGLGQVVLLSGEAGIGKSRLVQVLTAQVAAEPQAWLTPCHCSPYHQHSALYPWIDLLERVVLRFEREESPRRSSATRGVLGAVWPAAGGGGAPLAPSSPSRCPSTMPPSRAPERQKQKTLQALLTVLLRIAAQQPVLLVMEDCTGSIRPRWNCSPSWSIKVPPPASWRCHLSSGFSPPWTGAPTSPT